MHNHRPSVIPSSHTVERRRRAAAEVNHIVALTHKLSSPSCCRGPCCAVRLAVLSARCSGIMTIFDKI
jgi:hypothetical protein